MSAQSKANAETTDNVWWAAPALISILADTIAFLVRTDAAQAAAWYIYFASCAAIVPVAGRALIKGLFKQLVRIPGLVIALFIAGSYLFVFHRDGLHFSP